MGSKKSANSQSQIDQGGYEYVSTLALGSVMKNADLWKYILRPGIEIR